MNFRQLQRVFPGIGSVLPSKYDRNSIVRASVDRLNRYRPVLEFVNSSGWKVLKKEYQTLLGGLREYICDLSMNAQKNADEIQRTSDFIHAAEMMLNLTDEIISRHEQAVNAIQRNQETAQG